MNLRSIDLNLLVMFDALIGERSVTRAAKKVGITPSAMSHALGRLRDTFHDPLIERTPHGMIPTQRALDLAKSVRAALDELQHGIDQQLSFDPATAERTFNIRISDFLIGCLLPRLCTRVRAEAPGVTLGVEHLPSDGADPDRPGEIQLRIAAGTRGPQYRQERIWRDSFVVAMRPGHPAAQLPMTMERYAELPHLKVSSASIDGRQLDDVLDSKGLLQRTMVTIPSLSGAIPILQHTDLCTVVPRYWIDLYKGLGEVATRPLPVDGVEYCVDMIWQRRDDKEAGHRWLRQLIAQEFATLYAPARGPRSAEPDRLDVVPVAASR